MVADAAHERETVFEAPFVEIVEEQAADAARFVAVLEVEVVVAPFFETRIDIVAEGRRSGLARCLVPVHHVFLVAVVGRQVEAAAEPPDRVLTGFFGNEKAHIGVRRGHVRVAGMDDQ